MNNEKQLVKINTSKIKNISIKDDFINNFQIYRVKIINNEYLEFYKYLRKNINYYSDFKTSDFIYILIDKDINSSVYYFDKVNINILDSFIIFNLILKAIPYISKSKTFFSTAENLTYFYDIKECGKKGIKYREYIAFEVVVSPYLTLDINGVTYTEKNELSKLFLLDNNSKRLSSLKKRSVYYEDKGQVIHYSRLQKDNNTQQFISVSFEDNMKAIVKMRYSTNTKNSTKAISVDSGEFEKTKNACIYYLTFALDSISHFISFELEEIEGCFIQSKISNDSIGRTPTELSFQQTVIDFYKDKKLMIIDTTNNKENLERMKKEIYDYGIPYNNIYTSRTNIDKVNHFIVITNPESEYKNNKSHLKNDPYMKRHNLQHQHINIEQDKVKPDSFYKNSIPVLLKEIIIKDNLSNGKINYFEAQDNLLIRITPPRKERNENNTNEIFRGIHISNKKITHIDDDYIFEKANEFNSILENEQIQELYNSNEDFYIFSYGEKKSDLFFENVVIISSKKERPLPPIKQIGDKYYKDKNRERHLLFSRSMKNEGIDFAFAGAFGMFYREVNTKNVDYYIGSVISSVKATIPRFPVLYNASYIEGKFNPEIFFAFFEHYYIRNNDSTTLPYSNKYLREWELYSN